MIVEDETIISIDLECHLEELGHDVVATATTREHAFKTLEDEGHRIDAAILDVNLIGKSSRPIVDKLESLGIPYIVSSGYSKQFVQNFGYENLDVAKPYEPDRLREVISRLPIRSTTSTTRLVEKATGDRALGPLISRLTKVADLNDEQIDFLRSAVVRTFEVSKGRIIDSASRQGSAVLISHGWATTRKPSADDAKIVALHSSGDIVGLFSDTSRTAYQLVMQTPSRITLLQSDFFSRLLGRHDNLAKMIAVQASVEQAEMTERLYSVVNMNARDRIVHLLLSMRQRQFVEGFGTGDRFLLPLTQGEIGELVGLTAVWVNRTLMELRKEGLIEIEDKYVRLLRRHDLEASVDFTPAIR